MNRREFLRKSMTVAVAVTGFTLTTNLAQSSPVMAETAEQTNLETWLLATGQDELPAELYALATQKFGGEQRIFLPLLHR